MRSDRIDLRLVLIRYHGKNAGRRGAMLVRLALITHHNWQAGLIEP